MGFIPKFKQITAEKTAGEEGKKATGWHNNISIELKKIGKKNATGNTAACV